MNIWRFSAETQSYLWFWDCKGEKVWEEGELFQFSGIKCFTSVWALFMAGGEKSCGKKVGTTCTEIKFWLFPQKTDNSLNNFIRLSRFLYKGVLFIMVMDSLWIYEFVSNICLIRTTLKSCGVLGIRNRLTLRQRETIFIRKYIPPRESCSFRQ